MAHILVVDDEPNILKVLSAMLAEGAHEVATTVSAEQALEMFRDEKFDLVLSDIRMEPMDGIELLKRLKKINPDRPVIMMTAYGSIDNAVQAMKEGAYHYLIKPVQIDELNLLIHRALNHSQLLNENRQLKTELEQKYHFKNIVGNCEAMQRVYRLIEKISRTDSTVLLTGDSGTGKELVARALHYNSLRKDRPFVAINCATLPESLLESELFGHVKGAFTGAVTQKEGLFSIADGGTIFLDEVSATSPAIQSKLLRVLQEKEIKKVGDTRTTKVDVRIITATNLSLEEEVKKKNFREDLFYRLSVIPIDLPPLRQRTEDIPLLVKHFLEKTAQAHQSAASHVDERVLERLIAYPWPGNIRELENVIERMVTLADKETLTLEDLPPHIRNSHGMIPGAPPKATLGETNLKKVMEQRELEHIAQVMDEVHWDKKIAAQLLEVDLATLYRKLEKLGLKR